MSLIVPILGSASETSRSPLHSAIALWLGEKPEAALVVIEASARTPAPIPGRGFSESAALRNLGARLLYDQYRRLRVDRYGRAKALLLRAQTFAAAAVWENPYDRNYWRDYLRIASEEKPLAAVGYALIHDHLRYDGLGRVFELTESQEFRITGFAVVREMQGDVLDAERVLHSWLEEPSRSGCVAAAIAADFEFDMDHFANAKKLLEKQFARCDRTAADALAAKMQAFTRASSLTDVAAPADTVNGREDAVSDDGREFRAYTTVHGRIDDRDEHPFDIANRLLRDPSRIEDWHRLWDAAGTDVDLQACYDQVLACVLARPGAHRDPIIAKARAYRLIDRGRFGVAGAEIGRMIAASEGIVDPDLLVASVLIDADAALAKRSDTHKRLDDATRADPELTACLDRPQLDRCLQRRRRCSLALIVCSDATEFVYHVWEAGRLRRPRVLEDLDERGKKTRDDLWITARMIRDTDARLMAEIRSREGLARRIDALEDRVSVIVDVRLAEFEKRLMQQGLDQDEFEMRITAKAAELRSEVFAKIEQAASEATRAVAAATRATELLNENKLTISELARLMTHHVADFEVLKALRAELPGLMERERARLQPVIDHLVSAVDELQRPDLVRYMNTLRNFRNEPWERTANALTHVLNELAQMAVPGPGWIRAVMIGIPAVKAASDFFLDSRERAKKSGAVSPR